MKTTDRHSRHPLDQPLAGLAASGDVLDASDGRPEEIVDREKGSLRGEIDELKKSINHLLSNERGLTLVFDSVSTILFNLAVEPDDNFRFVSANRAFFHATGLDESQVIGKLARDVIPDPGYSIALDHYKCAVRDGKSVRWEEISVYPTGTKYGVVDITPFLDESGRCTHLIGTVGDITDRVEAENRLKISERKYRELIENANSIILRWNCDGRITFINEYGLTFFGYREDELLGRHVVGTIVPTSETSGRDLKLLMERVLADPKSFEQNTNENVCRDGQRVWVSWTNKIVVDAGGRIVEVLSIGTDVTKRRQAEEQVRQLNIDLRHQAEILEQRVAERTAQLAEARDRAEAADRLKSAFLATMSHELRTPLNSIIGFTGIVLQRLAGPLNDEQAKQLGMVRDSARHLLALINDVLDISKIEAGELDIAAAPFDLVASVDKVAAIVGPLAEKKGLALSVHVGNEVGDMVGDQRRVEQILLNLVGNAIKFTDRGGVALHASVVDDFTPVGSTRPCPAVRLRVQDTGIGIESDKMTLLFQPFRQLDSDLSRVHEGTGLGLAICRRLAEKMGGSIVAESHWQVGSVFTVTLPLNSSLSSASP
jgi:PAS domain S-box-containing protein